MKDPGAGCGRRTLHDENVFDADRNASQWGQRIALGGECVNPLGLLKRAFFGEAEVDVQMGIDFRDPVVIACGEVGSFGGSGGDPRTQLLNGCRLFHIAFR